MLPFPVDPMVLDEFEVGVILDAEFSQITGIHPSRCKLIREDFEAFSSTGEYEPVNYVSPDPPISEEERERYQTFHTPRTHLYACVLPGEIVRQCVDRMVSGTLDPAELLGIEHLIVDEYQDFNPVDLEFVNWLADRGVATFVAGDDDQSIYSFRYATPEGIQSFLAESGQPGDHELLHCFRCTPSVLGIGQNLISAFAHPTRIPKHLSSLYLNSDPPDPGVSISWRFPSPVREAREIAHSCAALIQSGVSAREIMILLSYTDLQLQVLRPELEAAEIPFRLPSEKNYIDSPDGRFAISMLRLVCDRDDYVAYRLILGLLPGVGPGTCDAIAVAMMDARLRYREIFEREPDERLFAGRARTALSRARNYVAIISTWTPEDLIGDRTDEIAEILADLFGEDPSEEWRHQIQAFPDEMNLQEVRSYLWIDDAETRAGVLESVYERLELEPPEGGFVEDEVQILTMHGAKGLDAQVVFIPGLEEEMLPGARRGEYTGLVLESARLLYVSITRAKAACILSFAGSRVLHGEFTRTTPSRFVSHLGEYFEYRDDNQLGFSATQVARITECIENL
jgi:DNA helicase-2/ATP-dependent DNA helicase PcrA